ncbi:DUF1799 domain-containing protein [Telmatospirillum sp. J64-1]|uniref:DUF1799 domain-containing protein n=1 Tax=Telmatospirillum sp. J64-1 TaxID=2502183 RepID=UPI001C8F9660|nr:DUF1799 domain-containing protein [Telmatospirillum sp. J64-1]
MFGPAGPGAEVAADLEAFGAPPALIEQLKAEAEAAAFPVWRENSVPFGLFLNLSTQWRLAPEGQPLGLDYHAAEAAARWMRIKRTPDLFEDLRVMELAALQAMAEKRKRS